MTRNLFVLKFGGSSLATPDQIIAVAKKISELHRSGKKLIVVTSAMGKTTDQLNELARKVSSRPNRRELDMLLTTGERVSMALMSIALHDLNCPSISFTGSQAGIMTDGSFTNAKITELKPIRVEEALLNNKVVVLAGFQGVDPATKEITTLGRGGSDTTAVAMASHFGAKRCEILKDVDGVMNTDPKIVPQAQLIKKMPMDALYEFCFWGAKVLNYRSVELARDRQVPLAVGRSDNFSIGTEVVNGVADFKNGDFVGVNSHEYVMQITIPCIHTEEGINKLKNISRESNMPLPHILRDQFADGRLELLLASDASDFNDMNALFANSSQIKILKNDISTVTASYIGRNPEIKVVPRAEREKSIRSYF